MAKYVIGAVEIVAGIYFENPSLIAMGAATILGAALTPKPPTQYGPRLQDLKMQVSTYGKFIPITYGAMRIAGNVIWSTPKIETTHESGGGKGGGGPKQVDYTYAISFAVALCEGPIIGIRRIWANGKLIYNLGSGADIATVIASNSGASGFRVYTGTTSQLPDSLIQSYVGINNCPAYRDTAYVVFENLQLANFYNQMPNLEFEVISAGTTALSAIQWSSGIPDVDTPFVSSYFNRNGIVYRPSESNNGVPTGPSGAPKTLTWYMGNAGTIIKQNTITLDQSIPYYCWLGVQDEPGVVYRYVPILTYVVSNYIRFVRPDGTIQNYLNGDPIYNMGAGYIKFCRTYGMFSVLSDDYLTLTSYDVHGILRKAALPGVAKSLWHTPTAVFVMGNGYPTASDVWIRKYDATTLNVLLTTSWNNTTSGLPTSGSFYPQADSENTIYLLGSGGANYGLYLYDGNTTVSLLYTLPIAANSQVCSMNYSNGVINFCTLGSAGSNNAIYTVNLNALSTTSVPVSSIVSDLCTRAGLQTTDIDVSQLTDLCDGYTVTNLSTARAAIEPLMQAFYFNADESDGKIKFVKRGQQPQVIIPEDDLAAHSYGAQMPDQVLSVRSQELDLPSEITLDYMDKDADYIIGTQYSRRLTTSSKAVTTIQMAMSLSASKAKQITQVLLAEAWMARNNRNFTTTDKYSKYETTDVVQIVKDGKTYTVRITNKDESGGICKFSAVDEDPTLYTQNAVAASLPPPIQTVAGASITKLQLLDIPLLRDQDDGIGFYLSACSYSGTFGGTQVFKSSDSGASWNAYGAGVLNAGTIGSTSDALGNFLSGNIFDETNTVSVTLINGTLSSITELGVLNGGNYALIGSEIIQFKNATLTATNTYTLSGLLRGRQGTEWAMSSHIANERFVFLSSTNVYIEQSPSSEYNIARLYAGVAFGSYLADAQQITFTNTAVAQKPYSPVLLGGGRDASGNITINWTRRGRIAGGWTDYSDIPLGEASQSYDVEIWDSTYTTLKRTFTALTTPTASYTSANQVADFGSNQATVYTRVYQNSATVGRGYKLQGTI